MKKNYPPSLPTSQTWEDMGGSWEVVNAKKQMLGFFSSLKYFKFGRLGSLGGKKLEKVESINLRENYHGR